MVIFVSFCGEGQARRMVKLEDMRYEPPVDDIDAVLTINNEIVEPESGSDDSIKELYERFVDSQDNLVRDSARRRLGIISLMG